MDSLVERRPREHATSAGYANWLELAAPGQSANSRAEVASTGKCKLG